MSGPITRPMSRSAAAPADNRTFVRLNCLFFDPNHPHDTYFTVPISRESFNEESPDTRPTFIDALLKEFGFTVNTGLSYISLYKPKEILTLETIMEEGWTLSVGNFRDQFERIKATKSLAEVLAEVVANDSVIHISITAKGHYGGLTLKDEENHDENDSLPPLPENIRYKETQASHTKIKSPFLASKSKEYAISQGKKSTIIYDGLHAPLEGAPTTVAPPLHIFHPVFAEFVRDANDVSIQVEIGTLVLVEHFMSHVSTIRKTETILNADCRRLLSEILGHPVTFESNDDNTSPDGSFVVIINGVRFPILLVELKRSLGEGGCDPAIQAGNSYRQAMNQESRKEIVNTCGCPVFMIAGGGPWLSILGGVYIDKFIVQRLTDMMWIGTASTHEGTRILRLARVLLALGNSLSKLEKFYLDVTKPGRVIKYDPNVLNRPYPRHYPYPNTYLDRSNNRTIKFKYLRCLEDDPRSVTYLAETEGLEHSENVVIKFVDEYGVEVHDFLAAQQHAPRLRYYGPLPAEHIYDTLDYASNMTFTNISHKDTPGPAVAASMKMVVMDFVKSSLEYRPSPSEARSQIEDILKKLHSNGYVFGDLREPNILYDSENDGRVKLIDFDWAGRYDVSNLPQEERELILTKWAEFDMSQKHVGNASQFARYPLGLSKAISWANGAGSLLPILPLHEPEMLAKMI